MKTKKSLIPKSKLWISLTLIFLPVLSLILIAVFDMFGVLGIKKISNVAASISLLGMFLLFMTQWTKDDGDEMYLQMRLKAVLSGVVTGITILLVSALFDLLNWFGTEDDSYSGFRLMFLILLMQLTFFGQQMYSLSKQKEEEL